MYERSVLIFDDSACALGDTSLGLIALGVNPYYANNLDDAMFLAGEHRQRIGAFAAPTSLLLGQLDLVRKELLALIGLPVSCAVPIGGTPSAEERARLAAAGVLWGAFEPTNARELRFLLALALSQADRKEARREPRFPVNLKVDVTTDERTFRASLTDLSASGGYLAARSPLKPGTRLALVFTLDDRRVEVGAEVRWRTALDGGFAGWLDAGMGVEFTQIAYETRAVVRRHLNAMMQRFELAAPDATRSATGAGGA
ncbi:MAG TPA: PilZ domain-containing protein [Myxococcota bacterium]